MNIIRLYKELRKCNECHYKLLQWFKLKLKKTKIIFHIVWANKNSTIWDIKKFFNKIHWASHENKTYWKFCKKIIWTDFLQIVSQQQKL